MSGEYSKAAFDAAFGRPQARSVTEADQAVARAFQRPVPELTEARESTSTPEAEMESLLKEFRELRVSRRGDPPASANAAGIRERAAIVDHIKMVTESRVVVRDRQALAQLRLKVEEMRAELPLSAGSPQGGAREARQVSAEEFDRAFERPVTQAEAEESAARAFGRTSAKGEQW